jgi:hypothetical protein
MAFCANVLDQIQSLSMTRQKHPNLLRDPELPVRFACLLARHMVKSRISDEELARRMSELPDAGSVSVTTIRRHKDGAGGSPTNRMIGIYKEALNIPDHEIDLLLDPDHVSAPGAPAFSDFNEQWRQLHEYFRRQSQLPHHIQFERARAHEAVKEEKYDKARKHLEKVSEWAGDSYRQQEVSLAYAAEEYGGL